MGTPYIFWIGFNVAVIVLLGLELTILGRAKRNPSFLESVVTTLVWMALAIAFGVWLGGERGWGKGEEFFTGYVIEYSLSLDNLFLFILIFSSFQVTHEQQRRLLLWGMIGALVLRGTMIFVGVALLMRFEWITYLFGAYIIYAGVSILAHKPEENMAAGETVVVRLARRFLPLSSANPHGHFMVWEDGRLKFTILFLVLVVVEVTDLIFALDSIPAVFGVTRDPFIVYTSNICAIVGLRSLYFVLARFVRSLVYLRFGLAGVLIFIGAKMASEDFIHISTRLSLSVVGTIMTVAVVASLVKLQLDKRAPKLDV